MPKFTVIGVDRESKLDTELVIEASTAANAKAKAELEGVLVTEVVDRDAPPEFEPPAPSAPAPPAAPRSVDATTVAFGTARGILLAIGIIVLLFLLLVFLGGR